MQLPFTLQYHLALDLGTAWTRGASLEGRYSSTKTQRDGTPGMRGGEVSSASTCREILSDLFKVLRPPFLRRPHVVACIPVAATEKQRALFTTMLYESGAWSVTLVQQALAAAMGAGLDPGSDYAQMVVDVGDGITEYSVIREGRVDWSHSVRSGCSTIRERIAGHCTGEQGEEILTWMETGLFEARPDILSPELVASLEEPIGFLADEARALFELLPDKIACEVIENGITLVGGGALMRELKRQLSSRTGLAVRIPGNPLTAAIEGAKQVIPYVSRK